jgi:hypothetical protein
MLDADRFKLRFGPYLPPRCRPGRWIRCALSGMVKVVGMSSSPIPWPVARRVTGGPSFLIITDALVRAIRRESNQAIAHHFGVTPQTVTVWRKALGVPQANEGTSRLQADWMPERLDDAARERQRQASRSPERAAKIAAARRGKPMPAHVAEILRRVHLGRKATAETRAKMSAAQKARGTVPPCAGKPWKWKSEWDALLGTMPDRALGAQLGVNYLTVWRRRKALGVPSCRPATGGRRNAAGMR